MNELIVAFFAIVATLAVIAAIYFYQKLAFKTSITDRALDVAERALVSRNEEMLVDLELATTDQLLSELKSRPMVPFLLVRPQEQGVLVESHNVTPVHTAQMLTFAAFIVQKQLNSQGIEFDGPRFMDD